LWGGILARIKIERNISFDDERKLFYVNMDYGNDEKGIRIKKTKTFIKKSEALKALKEFEADKTKGSLVAPSSTTFQDWIQYWIEDVKSMQCAETTLYGYRNIINNHLIPILGKCKLQDMSVTMLNKYFKKKQTEGLTKTTIRKHYDLLKSVFKQALDEEKILKNPLDKIDPIKPEDKEMNFYNTDQLKTLFAIIEDDRMEIVVKLAGLLGLRREEIAGLKWKNVDFEDKTIKISEVRTQAGKDTIEKGTKTKSSKRTLHMPDEILELLKKIRSIQEENQKILLCEFEYVVAWDDGKPYRPNYLSDLFKKIIDDHKLPPLRLHDLRHTFASLANELGISLYDISKALGHGDVGVTSKVYTHSFDKTHKSAISKIASILSD
jgi:integrase